MLGIQVTEEQLQSIAERAIQEADLDKDDAISFEEFKKVRELMTANCQKLFFFSPLIFISVLNKPLGNLGYLSKTVVLFSDIWFRTYS